LVIAVALVLAAVVGIRQHPSRPTGSAAGSVDQASVTRADGREDTVGAMLTRRADALRTKDRAAFLDTVDAADPQFRTAETTWFDNQSVVPFDTWSLSLAGRSVAGIPPAATAAVKRIAAGTFAGVVEASYRISGYDNAPQRYERVLTFTPRHGRWLVSGSFDPAGVPAHRELWDVGQVHALGSDHGLILGLEPTEELRTYAREVDREVPLVKAVWGPDWAGRVLVEVTRTEDEMAVLLGGVPASYRQLAAVTRGELGITETTVAAERIIVNPKAYGELSDVGRQVIMGHEITHVASRASTQSWTPRWLAEGLADYVGYSDSGLSTRIIAQELAADVKHGLVPAALPSDEAFAATNANLAQSYEMSWLACRMIAERYGGAGRLVAFYRAVGGPGGLAEVNRAFREVLSTTPEQFVEAWRGYVKQELG